MIANDSPMQGRTSLLTIGDLALRYRRLLIFVPLLMVAAAVTHSLLEPKSYSAESRFMPQSPKGRNNALAGFAAQFGINVDPQGATESPEFYAALIKTRDLLTEAARAEYEVAGKRAPLGELLNRKRTLTTEQTVDILERDVSTRPEPRTGMIVVHTVAPSGELAVQVNNRLLQLVAAFNLQKRQSNAAAERQFVEARTRDAQRELENSEAELESFMAHNRQYAGSPQLSMEAARLERRVQLRQDVYTSLAQAYEQARVDEVRNTPLITVVDRPDASVRREGSGLVGSAALALVLGFILAVLLAVASEKLRRESQENPEAFERLRATMPRFIPVNRIMRVIAPVATVHNGGQG